MYLKNLTMLGFKSFCDKTPLNFQPGITAIVGPNGCGKSNVADAIRWVLGEQSAKALRGGEMADVIFNGTEGRRAIGMAEVSLTIGDVDAEHLQAAGVELAYNEVTLTRRVFRDGGSEYFINRTPCRLKDIQQLFMGTGVGRTSYSIMAQGNITQILSSKPEDRRMVFEEAAGITKFKSQKREALRKLEYTEQNLLRVGDLIREVKRQIGSLQRQAGKARRYKQIMLELQHLDTQLARHQFDVLQAEIAERRVSLDQLRHETEAFSQNVLRDEDEIASLRVHVADLERQVSQSQQRGLELKSEIDRHESRIHFNQERLLEFQKNHQSALDEVSQAEKRRSDAEQEITLLGQKLTESTQTLEKHRQTFQAKQDELQRIERGLSQHHETQRQIQAKAFALGQQLTRARNETNALDLQKQGNVVRLEKLSAEKIQLEEERVGLERRLEEFASNVESEKQDVQKQRGTMEERQERLRQIHRELDETTRELDRHLQQQAEIRSRLDVLEQLQSEHEGYGTGALAALKQAEHVLGTLADRIWVADEHVTAVETALGHHLELVLTHEPEMAERILSELNVKKSGRASIAPLSFHKAQPTGSSQTIPEGRGIPAMKAVVADPSIQTLVEALIGRTLIVPDIATATAAWRETGGQFDFVTATGDRLDRFGVYTGGYRNGNGSAKTPSSILGRKNQIAELSVQAAQLQERVNETSRRKGSLSGEQTALQAGLQQAQSALREREVAVATREGEFTALQGSRRVLHQKIDTVVYEIQSLAAQEEEAARKRLSLTTEIGQLEEQERDLQKRLTDVGAGLENLRQQRDTTTTALTESKVSIATEQQIGDSFRKQKQPLDQRIEELGVLVRQRQTDISTLLERKARAESEIVESEGTMGSLQFEREQVNHRTAQVQTERESQEEEIARREESLREQRRRLGEINERRGALEVEQAQKNMSLQNLRDRIQQRYQVNLDEVRSECITITIAAEGPARIKTLTPEEMAAGGLSTDWDAVAEQAAALQKRLDELGPVNLVAIDEYEETEQRYQFLSKQNDDLVKAKEQLNGVIHRIDTQTREMFTETFDKIRENFRNMFTEVFGGGKADLVLVEGGDALECGIDIVARPPGKQLQTISLLSGGEQTMTAVALLFAIYQVKPSPFCVLDELDAPLDESNINRFIRILQRFLVHSQFIIITHNKRTIGMANVLYGVTMEEQGVSKIVSVKFHKVDDAVTDHRPVPLVPPPQEPAVDVEEEQPHSREETFEIVMAK